MCKNSDNPCPGCKKQKPADAKWLFFSEEERQALTKWMHGPAKSPDLAEHPRPHP
ncbi:hypothetical protein [Tropicimonas marinistellae]|uniref:hypothetical protein n=1 Tax=Tropicimonas marinistellae TaxID=1739787 RepID=UPI0013732C6A|nr:hypothetical protein [Tropicimonas marinistellae]